MDFRWIFTGFPSFLEPSSSLERDFTGGGAGPVRRLGPHGGRDGGLAGALQRVPGRRQPARSAAGPSAAAGGEERRGGAGEAAAAGAGEALGAHPAGAAVRGHGGLLPARPVEAPWVSGPWV